MFNTSHKGFTLIELLLAMSITAVAAVMAYQSMDSAGRLAEVSQAEGDALQRLSSAMNIMAKDFRQVVSRPVRNPDGAEKFDDAFVYSEFALPMLQFTRTGKLNPQLERFQRDHLERIAYQLEDDKLWRYSWPMVDRYSDLEPQKIALFDDVSEFKVRLVKVELQNFSSGQVPQYKKEYVDSWPDNQQQQNSEGSAVIPHGIELEITTKRWGVIKRRFEIGGEL